MGWIRFIRVSHYVYYFPYLLIQVSWVHYPKRKWLYSDANINCIFQHCNRYVSIAFRYKFRITSHIMQFAIIRFNHLYHTLVINVYDI